jgi:DNA-binding response OmpR family regulator
VDDDPDIRQGMHVRLRANHYDTFFAANAVDAVAETRKHKPDLIILDLGLTADNGFTVIERLKQVLFLAVIPIIVVTARDPHPNRARALEAGARAFLQKPVDDDEFLLAIREALGEPEPQTKPTRYAGAETAKAVEAPGRSLQDHVLKAGQSDSAIRTMPDAIDRKQFIIAREAGRRQITKDDGQLSAHLSLEFRSALACIFQFGNILMGGLGGELSEEQRQYLGIMLENASHIRSMLDGLLEGAPAGLGEAADKNTKCADKNGPLSTKAT